MAEKEYIEREALMEVVRNKKLIFEESTPVEEAVAEQLSVIEEAIEEFPTADVVPRAEVESCKMRYEGMMGGMFAGLIGKMKSEALRTGDMFANTQDEYYRGKSDAYKDVITLLKFVKEKYTEVDNETQTNRSDT